MRPGWWAGGEAAGQCSPPEQWVSTWDLLIKVQGYPLAGGFVIKGESCLCLQPHCILSYPANTLMMHKPIAKNVSRESYSHHYHTSNHCSPIYTMVLFVYENLFNPVYLHTKFSFVARYCMKRISCKDSKRLVYKSAMMLCTALLGMHRTPGKKFLFILYVHPCKQLSKLMRPLLSLFHPVKYFLEIIKQQNSLMVWFIPQATHIFPIYTSTCGASLSIVSSIYCREIAHL